MFWFSITIENRHVKKIISIHKTVNIDSIHADVICPQKGNRKPEHMKIAQI